jgi:hypothetical protein
MGQFPGLSSWALPDIRVLIRGQEVGVRRRNVMAKAEVGVMQAGKEGM